MENGNKVDDFTGTDLVAGIRTASRNPYLRGSGRR